MYPLPPGGTELGELSLLKVFEHYDYPQLFSCTDRSGKQFLALHVEEAPRPDTWLFVGVSPSRLAQLERGELDLHAAVTAAEDGFVFRVVQERDRGTARVDHLSLDGVLPDWVPGNGELLVRHRSITLPVIEIAPGESAQSEQLMGAFAHLRVINRGPFVSRVQGWVRFRADDGTPLFSGGEMPLRWSSAPEPITPVIGPDGRVQYVPNPSLLPIAFVQDFAREEEHVAAVAIRLPEGAWGFTPESYFYNFKHEKWHLPEGKLHLEVRVRADGVDHHRTLALNSASPPTTFGVVEGDGAVATSEPAQGPTRIPTEGIPPRHLKIAG